MKNAVFLYEIKYLRLFNNVEEFVYQGDEKGCGFAAIRNLLNIVSKSRRYSKISTNYKLPLSLEQIQLIGKENGLNLIFKKALNCYQIYSNKSYPILAIISQNSSQHIVVIKKRRKNKLLIYDSSLGKYYLKIEEFMACWTLIFGEIKDFISLDKIYDKKRKNIINYRVYLFDFVINFLLVFLLIFLFSLLKNKNLYLFAIFILTSYFLLEISRKFLQKEYLRLFDFKYQANIYDYDFKRRKLNYEHYFAFKQNNFVAKFNFINNIFGLCLLSYFFISNNLYNLVTIFFIFSFSLCLNLILRAKKEKLTSSLNSGEKQILDENISINKFNIKIKNNNVNSDKLLLILIFEQIISLLFLFLINMLIILLANGSILFEQILFNFLSSFVIYSYFNNLTTFLFDFKKRKKLADYFHCFLLK